jgi:hypothetical protein
MLASRLRLMSVANASTASSAALITLHTPGRRNGEPVIRWS